MNKTYTQPEEFEDLMNIFDTPEQRAFDRRCIRWNHHIRNIAYCSNPQCPGRRPEYQKLRALNDFMKSKLPSSNG